MKKSKKLLVTCSCSCSCSSSLTSPVAVEEFLLALFANENPLGVMLSSYSTEAERDFIETALELEAIQPSDLPNLL